MRTISITLVLGQAIAQQLSLETYSGDDLRLNFVLQDDEGAPIPLTDIASIRWAFSKQRDAERFSSAAVVTKTLADGDVVVDSYEDGEFHLKLLGDDTENIAGEYRHELQVTDQSGNRTTLMVGPLSIHKDLLED